MDEKALEAALKAFYNDKLDRSERMRAAITAYLEATGLEKDKERLEWVGAQLFERKWDGTIGRPSDWFVRGDFRHTTQKMKGQSFREAIDEARK